MPSPAAELEKILHAAMGEKVGALRPLSGGCVGEVYRGQTNSGRPLVIKHGDKESALSLEGWMLGYLREKSDLPVPEVFFARDDLLVMEYLESGDGLDPDAQTHAAELLAALHEISAPRFGLCRPTLIGGLNQPNEESDSWIDFFRDQRLLYMARVAHEGGQLPLDIFSRLEKLASRLSDFITEPARPSLIHGDMWGGNVLAKGGRITGFVDPAIYYADAEIELAFSTLFSTFGNSFFNRYRELRKIEPGFFEERRDLYNLYPLLVHVRLFGGSYIRDVSRTLSRFGF